MPEAEKREKPEPEDPDKIDWSKVDWRKRVTRMQYYILREAGTSDAERAAYQRRRDMLKSQLTAALAKEEAAV